VIAERRDRRDGGPPGALSSVAVHAPSLPDV
jgi:hypothetical protein